MVRRLFCILVVLLVFFVVLLPVCARGHGTIQVYPMCADRRVSGGMVTLYRIGEPVSGGFQLTGKLSRNTLSDKDVFSETFLSWILRRLPDTGTDAKVEKGEGAVFGGLEEGLYVIVQKEASSGYTKFRPFIVSLPMGEQWEISANPKIVPDTQTPETGDDFTVVIGLAGMLLSALGLAVLEGKRRW